MLDLMNLNGELKTGFIANDGGRTISVVTPVFRMSFPELDTPKQFKGTGKPRFTCSMLFNTGNKLEPALVSLKGIEQSLDTLARVHKMSMKANGVNPFGSGEKYNQSGDPIDGYAEGMTWGTMSKYPKTDQSTIQCFGADGNACSPDKFYGGCYTIARIQIYKPRDWARLSLGIEWVQFVTDGPRFGGDDIEYDAPAGIPGADTINPPSGIDF